MNTGPSGAEAGVAAVPRAEPVAARVLPAGPVQPMDADSAEWLRLLRTTGSARESSAARLHAMLLRAARAEVNRRGHQRRITGPELDDLAHQAAADALVTITSKLDTFRGESRFTTWAYKFVMFEVSAKLGRHFWQQPRAELASEDWDRLPDRLGFDPARESEWRDLVAEVRRLVDTELTDWQRQVFVAVVVDGIPLDAVVARAGSTRNAVYKAMFDGRRKLRAALVTNGYLDRTGQPPATGPHRDTGRPS